MIWYSPELNEIMVVLVGLNQINFEKTELSYAFVCEEFSNEEKIKGPAWFYIGEI